MSHVAGHVRRFRRLGAELWSDGRGPILVAVASGWFLSLGVRMIYPAVLPQLREAYGFDLTLAGVLITALWIAYALGQLPGGVLDDRFGSRNVLVVSTGVSAIALTLVVTAGSVGVLFGATVLFGFATALYGVTRFTLLSTIYPDRGGTAIGLTMGAGDFGNAVLPPIAGALAAALAWELGFGFTIPLFLVATVGLYLALPAGSRDESSADSDDTNADDTDFTDTARRIARALRHRPVMLVAAIQTLGYCTWQAFTAFYPTYLVEMKGLEPTTATVLFGGFFALGIVVKPVTGSIYDAYGARRSLPFVLGSITVATLVLPFVESLAGLVAVTAVASSVLGYSTISLTYLTASFPDDVRGTGLGSVRTGYMLIGAGSPTVVGVLANADYFDEAFFLLSAVAAVAVVLSLLVPEE
ncbi:MFS transporter [Natronobacterium texcoconense]|uniref:Sugar phosphate permease n=1 Tax=Natronobacterium texcoconense TaxID=1095778 RepID=A0A1H1I3Y5_NATTX|nr:MFS transporter [Natronobacterium texcoconense]SDR32352.1 Sugar phosphate permease [Natronobacterium texcoconense]